MNVNVLVKAAYALGLVLLKRAGLPFLSKLKRMALPFGMLLMSATEEEF